MYKYIQIQELKFVCNCQLVQLLVVVIVNLSINKTSDCVFYVSVYVNFVIYNIYECTMQLLLSEN